MKSILALLIALLVLVAVGAIADDPLNAGDPNCDGANNVGDLTYTVAYLFQGGPAPCNFAPGTTPIALGTVSATGTVWQGTGNFTVSWNDPGQRYDITIDGENFYYSDYVTVVEPYSTEAPLIFTTASTGGSLVIYAWDLSGARVQSSFQFVVYKL